MHATIGRIPRIVQLLRVKKEEEEEEGGGGGISRLAKSQREENTSTLFRPFVTSSFTIRYEASVVSLTRRHRSVSNEFSHSLVYFPPFFYVSQGKKVFHQRDQRDTGNRPLAQNWHGSAVMDPRRFNTTWLGTTACKRSCTAVKRSRCFHGGRRCNTATRSCWSFENGIPPVEITVRK